MLWRYGQVVLIFAALVIAAILFDRFAPAQHNPTKPLDLTDPIGWATAAKLDRLQDAPSACFRALESGGVAYDRLDNSPRGEPCGFTDALYLKRSLTPYSSPIRTSCPLAAALNLWERHVLQPAAERRFGAVVERIETFGTFSCRRINGATSGRWSEHATANAIDIWGFRLSDGRTVNVKADWRARGAKGQFLEDVFSGGCDVFRVALGPDYNAAHADHFHFDMGPGLACE